MSNDQLDNLALVPSGKYSGLGLIFSVEINGEPYLKTLQAYEARIGADPAGAYTEALSEADIIERALETGSRLMPYACGCGEWGCWWISCEVEIYGEFVCWRNWTNPYRNDPAKVVSGHFWDYSELPPLVFDRKSYEAEMKKAQVAITARKPALR